MATFTGVRDATPADEREHDSALNMTGFRHAVAAVQPHFSGAEHEAYIGDVKRLQEADPVSPCVERAVLGELDPTGNRALGRLTRFSPPGLAEYLTSKRHYRPEDTAAQRALARATRLVLALGWLFACTPESIIAGRTARDVWDFWAGASLRDPLQQVLPKDLARMIHHNGADLLVNQLKSAGMSRWLGSSKLGQIGYQIVQHGFYLRMVQTDEIDEDKFQEAVEFRRKTELGSADGRWDWAAFPESELKTLPE